MVAFSSRKAHASTTYWASCNNNTMIYKKSPQAILRGLLVYLPNYLEAFNLIQFQSCCLYNCINRYV